MSFRLVPKSVTLNDLERRNGRYFALFQRIRVYLPAYCGEVPEVLWHLNIAAVLSVVFVSLSHLLMSSLPWTGHRDRQRSDSIRHRVIYSFIHVRYSLNIDI